MSLFFSPGPVRDRFRPRHGAFLLRLRIPEGFRLRRHGTRPALHGDVHEFLPQHLQPEEGRLARHQVGDERQATALHAAERRGTDQAEKRNPRTGGDSQQKGSVKPTFLIYLLYSLECQTQDEKKNKMK